VIFKTEVDWNGRMFDSCGKCGKAETPHRLAEEAQLTPRGKRAFWSGKQLTHTDIVIIYTKALNK